MIHYHGQPITPATASAEVLAARHAFVSFARPDQLDIAKEVCQSFAGDNGAFSAWKSGAPITDWTEFYGWAERLLRVPNADWVVIPDVIDGDEAANDALVKEWPHGRFGVPVWHLHESLGRLQRLAAAWPRVALGSSGAYAKLWTPEWWRRMDEAMRAVCDDTGRPATRLHGLRMLSPRVVEVFPFSSADSTNVAQNIGIDSHWTGSYQVKCKAWRANTIARRIELANSPERYIGLPEGIARRALSLDDVLT